MPVRIPSTLLSVLLLAAPAVAGSARGAAAARPLAPIDAKNLAAIDDSSLGELRAGAPVRSSSMDPSERAGLAQAASSACDLEELRGGELVLSNHDLQLIVIVAVVVLILVLI